MDNFYFYALVLLGLLVAISGFASGLATILAMGNLIALAAFRLHRAEAP